MIITIINKIQENTFIPNKPFGKLIDIPLKSLISLKNFTSQSSFIEA